MTKDRWKRIKPILEAARELPEEERSAYLEQACENDDELRREVETFLSADVAAVEYLDRPVFDFEGEGEDLSGTTIGPYLLERALGAGGIGVVYLACRDDAEFERQVAIKVLKRGMDSDELSRRFRDERQILASLDHPHIARLFDGGTSASGRLYFVMEYIEGQSLSAYCAEQNPGLTARLRLFQKICGAVQVAHRNLIVHRDLKPGNILVTAEGEPKLLDFGIAKLLDPAASGITAAHYRRLTPEYASPEQISGEPITTGSDIYSLGVILYQLLSGQLPYRFETRSEAEVKRTVTGQEPLPPSTAGRRPQLRGDLDTIVLKALRKEPDRRYASVEQFSADIDRHLRGLPVLARKDTWRYRTGKFIRRNRIGLSIAAMFVLLVLGFGTAMVREQQETARQRDRAERTAEFLQGLFRAADPFGGSAEALSAQDLLAAGVSRITTTLAEESEVRVALLQTMAEVHSDLGLYEQAKDLARQALELHRRHSGAESSAYATSQYTLAVALAELGDLEASQQLLTSGLELRRRLLGPDALSIADNLMSLGVVALYQTRLEDAEKYLREATDLREKAVGPRHPSVAEALNFLGLVLKDQRRYEEAEEIFLRSLAIYRRGGTEEQTKAVGPLHNLALVYKWQERYPEAERLHREVIQVVQEVLGPEHPHVATSLNSLALFLQHVGRFDEALPLQEQALEHRIATWGLKHRMTSFSLNNLGTLYRRLGRLEEAEHMLREAIRVREKVLSPEHPLVGYALSNLGRTLIDQERYDEARAAYEQAVDILKKADSSRLPRVLRGYANVLELLGLNREAEAIRNEAEQ